MGMQNGECFRRSELGMASSVISLSAHHPTRSTIATKI